MLSSRLRAAATMSLPKISATLLATESAEHPCARSSHGLSWIPSSSAATKGDGLLVLYGGEHVARTPLEREEQLWVFPSLKDSGSSWKRVVVKEGESDDDECLPPSRVAHAQAAIGNTIYIFGGRAGITMSEKAMNDMYKLEINDDSDVVAKWTKIEANNSPPEARSFHQMVAIGSSLFVFGGCSAKGRLADLHEFDTQTNTWTDHGTAELRGRGGANLIPLSSSNKLVIVGGFAGEETNDGAVFDLEKKEWNSSLLVDELKDMRPRSVCVNGSFVLDDEDDDKNSNVVSVIFGGEVDPSALGHEGAGGFANDVVVLDGKTGHYMDTIPAPATEWPETRGWSAAATGKTDEKNGKGCMYVFGGLSGDDTDPQRLNDLWLVTLEKP